MSQNKPSLRLGSVDRGAIPASLNDFFRRFHEGDLLGHREFRGESDDQWAPFVESEGTPVRDLQIALREHGFYPHGDIDGIFGYRTLSSVRLFQEYVRNAENRMDIGTPDGIVGSRTHDHLERWRAEAKQADWLNVSATNPSPEHRYWMEILKQYREINLAHPINVVIEMVNNFFAPADTIKTADWEFKQEDIHLIGIRRHEWRGTKERQNDDVFVLLVNGLVFKFYGSTDPNPSPKRRPDEPYIVRGQHRYRFGWHKIGDPQRVYRAFRPEGPGVLICRDFDHDDALTEADFPGGLSAEPTINIHWGGRGISNWSAGCQVICGARYVNHLNKKVDCTAYAARNYTELSEGTRGAYNVLLDILTVFAPSVSVLTSSTLYYTLLYERDFQLQASGGEALGAAGLAVLAGLGEAVLAQVKELVAVDNLVDRLIRDA